MTSFYHRRPIDIKNQFTIICNLLRSLYHLHPIKRNHGDFYLSVKTYMEDKGKIKDKYCSANLATFLLQF